MADVYSWYQPTLKIDNENMLSCLINKEASAICGCALSTDLLKNVNTWRHLSQTGPFVYTICKEIFQGKDKLKENNIPGCFT